MPYRGVWNWVVCEVTSTKEWTSLIAISMPFGSSLDCERDPVVSTRDDHCLNLNMNHEKLSRVALRFTFSMGTVNLCSRQPATINLAIDTMPV